MYRLRSLTSYVFAAVLFVVGQVLSAPPPAAAGAHTPPAVPEAIAVPADAVLLMRRAAAGVQIYECVGGQWAFRAPRALLFSPRTHRLTGSHYGGIDRGLTPGPWWEDRGDGSRIRAASTASAPSPNAGSIPLLRLEVRERHGDGVFSPVRYIQRLNTKGGVGPTGACATGVKRAVPYTADYYFYR